MKSRGLILGAAGGLLSSLPLMGISYLAQQVAGQPFLSFLLFEWLARALPGGAVTAGIDTMVLAIVSLGIGPIDVAAKAMEQATGMLFVIVGATVAGLLMAWLVRRTSWDGLRLGALFGVGAAVGALAMAVAVGPRGGFEWTAVWLLVLLEGWGLLLGYVTERLVRPSPATLTPASAGGAASRRDFLAWAAAASVAAAAWGAGRLIEARTAETGVGQALSGLRQGTPSPPRAGTSAPAAPAA
jgi:hypothetical protein